MDDNRIKVGVRIRPFNTKEALDGLYSTVGAEPKGRLTLTNDARDETNKSAYKFDWSYGPEDGQRTIYDSMCKPLIDKIFEGYNATFFAYGQTGSGKTYTMGTTTTDLQDGILPYSLQDIFQRKQELLENPDSGSTQITVELSYLEIYLEECYDLLNTNSNNEKKRLELRESKQGETYLDGLRSVHVKSIEDVITCISQAHKVRSTGKTAMNLFSSRSHAICIITIRNTITLHGATSVLSAQLNLVDLAGSERVKKTLATGDTFLEGVKINQGLSTLGKVVTALSTKQTLQTNANNHTVQHIHIPYRESKLTRLLKDSLGGNGVTCLLVCVSPALSNLDETTSTLQFAVRTGCIINCAHMNSQQLSSSSSSSVSINNNISLLSSTDQDEQMLEEITSLKQQVSSMSSQYHNSQELYLELFYKLIISLKTVLMNCLNDFEDDEEGGNNARGQFNLSDQDISFLEKEMSGMKQVFQAWNNNSNNNASFICCQKMLLLFDTIGNDAKKKEEKNDMMMMEFELPGIMKIIDDLQSIECMISLLLPTNFMSSTAAASSSMSMFQQLLQTYHAPPAPAVALQRPSSLPYASIHDFPNLSLNSEQDLSFHSTNTSSDVMMNISGSTANTTQPSNSSSSSLLEESSIMMMDLEEEEEEGELLLGNIPLLDASFNATLFTDRNLSSTNNMKSTVVARSSNAIGFDKEKWAEEKMKKRQSVLMNKSNDDVQDSIFALNQDIQLFLHRSKEKNGEKLQHNVTNKEAATTAIVAAGQENKIKDCFLVPNQSKELMIPSSTTNAMVALSQSNTIIPSNQNVLLQTLTKQYKQQALLHQHALMRWESQTNDWRRQQIQYEEEIVQLKGLIEEKDKETAKLLVNAANASKPLPPMTRSNSNSSNNGGGMNNNNRRTTAIPSVATSTAAVVATVNNKTKPSNSAKTATTPSNSSSSNKMEETVQQFISTTPAAIHANNSIVPPQGMTTRRKSLAVTAARLNVLAATLNTTGNENQELALSVGMKRKSCMFASNLPTAPINNTSNNTMNRESKKVRIEDHLQSGMGLFDGDDLIVATPAGAGAAGLSKPSNGTPGSGRYHSHIPLPNANNNNNSNKAYPTPTNATPTTLRTLHTEEIAASPWMQYTVFDLKQQLTQRGLAVSGLKQELVKRLIQYEDEEGTSDQVTQSQQSKAAAATVPPRIPLHEVSLNVTTGEGEDSNHNNSNNNQSKLKYAAIHTPTTIQANNKPRVSLAGGQGGVATRQQRKSFLPKPNNHNKLNGGGGAGGLTSSYATIGQLMNDENIEPIQF